MSGNLALEPAFILAATEIVKSDTFLSKPEKAEAIIEFTETLLKAYQKRLNTLSNSSSGNKNYHSLTSVYLGISQ